MLASLMTVATVAPAFAAPDPPTNGGKGIYVGGTLISILISLVLYLTGRRESAIFVGLWAPTILNLGQSLLEED